MRQFYIGTSGWSYDHWRGVFYPKTLAKAKWFDFYAKQFNAVEVNATYYRFFKDAVFEKWYQRAPEGFRYVLKVPGLITHRKYLKDTKESIERFCKQAEMLGDKLGMLLLQLAPHQPYDLKRLKAALLTFTDPSRVAVEFRHEKWLNNDVYALLQELGVAFCSVDSPEQALTDWVTGKRAYIRLHGSKRWYGDNYEPQALRRIATHAQQMVSAGAREVYIFFNNDNHAYAAFNALDLAKNKKMQKTQ